jgi:hypothetical protein
MFRICHAQLTGPGSFPILALHPSDIRWLIFPALLLLGFPNRRKADWNKGFAGVCPHKKF